MVSTSPSTPTADPLIPDLTTAQMIPLAIFCFFMTFFGLLGNATVLYSSIRYNSIKLDRITLIFVKNLAAADILYTIFTVFPNLVTFSAGRWVLGDAWCFISAQCSFVPGLANILIVLVITLYRLLLVTSPFLITRVITARSIAGTIWILGTLVQVSLSTRFKTTSKFDTLSGTCITTLYSLPSAELAVSICTLAFVMLPMCMITLSNVGLCIVACRHSRSERIMADRRKRQRNKGLVLVCLLSGMFIVSWLPYIIYNLVKKKAGISQELSILSFHCIFINSFGNPILYSLTNKRFGLYVRNTLKGLMFWTSVTSPAVSRDLVRMESSEEVRRGANRKMLSSQS